MAITTRFRDGRTETRERRRSARDQLAIDQINRNRLETPGQEPLRGTTPNVSGRYPAQPAPQYAEPNSTDRYEPVASTASGEPVLRDRATGETFTPYASTNKGTLYKGEPRYAQQAQFTPAPPRQSGFAREAGRFNPFSSQPSDFQDPAGMAASRLFGRGADYTRNKAQGYLAEGTVTGRVKALPFTLTNPLFRAGRGATRYAAENPERFFSNVALSGAGSMVIGRATAGAVNYFGGKLASRYGVNAGESFVRYTNYGMFGGSVVLTGSQLKGKTADEIGAMIPSFVAGGAGFYKGYNAGKPGIYVEKSPDVTNPKMEYRYAGGRMEAIGTDTGTATVRAFGKTEQVPFVTNIQVSGKQAFANNNRYYVGDIELATSLRIGNKEIYSGRSFKAGFDTKRRELFATGKGDILYARQGKESVFYEDTVERVMASNNQFVQLKDTKGAAAKKTGGGFGFTTSESFTYRDTTVNMFRSPYLQADVITSRPIDYASSNSIIVRSGKADNRFAMQGLYFGQKLGLYKVPEVTPNRGFFLRGRKGQAQLFAPELEPTQTVRTLPRTTGGTSTSFGLTGLQTPKFGVQRLPFALFGTGSMQGFGQATTTSLPRQFISQYKTIPRNQFKPEAAINSFQIQNPLPRFKAATIPKTISSTLPAQRSTMFPSFPSTITSPGFPALAGFSFPFGIPPSRTPKDTGSAGRKFAYFPDVTSILYGRRGRAPKSLGGFEGRPVPFNFRGIF